MCVVVGCELDGCVCYSFECVVCVWLLDVCVDVFVLVGCECFFFFFELYCVEFLMCCVCVCFVCVWNVFFSIDLNVFLVCFVFWNWLNLFEVFWFELMIIFLLNVFDFFFVCVDVECCLCDLMCVKMCVLMFVFVEFCDVFVCVCVCFLL